MIRALRGLWLLVLCARAWADAGETSLHLELGPLAMRSAGYASDARDDARSARSTAGGGRLGLRASYGLSNQFALEVGAGVGLGLGNRFSDQDIPGPSTMTAIEKRTDLLLRVTTGITARLGTRVIPTVTVFTGYQYRLLTGVSYVTNQGQQVNTEPVPSRGVSDFLIGVGVGLDYRINATWVIGVSVQLVHGFSTGGQRYDAVEAPVSLGGYWYPRWFASNDFVPGGTPLP